MNEFCEVRPPVAKSIMQARRECYVCRMKYNVSTVGKLEEHHVLNGPLRPVAEKYGLKVWLCHRHHNEPGYSAHFDHHLRLDLKSRPSRILRTSMDTTAGWRKSERTI